MQKLSFMLFFLNQLENILLFLIVFEQVCCCHGLFFFWQSLAIVSFWWREGRVLCIKLLGWGLLIGCAGGFPLSQVVAALVLLPHAVDEQEDEEDGKQEADHAACNNSWERQRQKGKVTINTPGSQINVSRVSSWTTTPSICPEEGNFSQTEPLSFSLRWIVSPILCNQLQHS